MLFYIHFEGCMPGVHVLCCTTFIFIVLKNGLCPVSSQFIHSVFSF